MFHSGHGKLKRDVVKTCFLFGQMKKPLWAILSLINAHLDVLTSGKPLEIGFYGNIALPSSSHH